MTSSRRPPAPRRFVISYDEPLLDTGWPSFDERIAEVDPAHTVKGAFFEDLVTALGPDLEALLPTLAAPPRAGRYIGFQAYPLRDHATVLYHAARKVHPTVSAREGIRRLQRGNLEAFRKTTTGRVLAALVGDLREDHARIGESFRLGRSAGEVTTRAIEDRAIELLYSRSHPFLDCGELGTLEGMGTFFGKRFRIEVELSSPVDASFVCRFLRD